MSASDRAAIEHVLGFALPAQARVLLFEREAGLDDMLRAKIDMPRLSFDAVAERLPVQLSAMSQGPGRLPADRAEWNPRSTTRIKSGQVKRPGGRVMNIGLAAADEHVTLFIVEHGT